MHCRFESSAAPFVDLRGHGDRRRLRRSGFRRRVDDGNLDPWVDRNEVRLIQIGEVPGSVMGDRSGLAYRCTGVTGQ